MILLCLINRVEQGWSLHQALDLSNRLTSDAL